MARESGQEIRAEAAVQPVEEPDEWSQVVRSVDGAVVEIGPGLGEQMDVLGQGSVRVRGCEGDCDELAGEVAGWFEGLGPVVYQPPAF